MNIQHTKFHFLKLFLIRIFKIKIESYFHFNNFLSSRSFISFVIYLNQIIMKFKLKI